MQMVGPDGDLTSLVKMKSIKTRIELQLQQLIQGTLGEREEAGFWEDDASGSHERKFLSSC